MSSNPQWSPALGAGKSRRPRWSLCTVLCRNGAQLLELGKGGFPWLWSSPGRSRNGAQLLELGKGRPHSWLRGLIQPQWSPAFGAGKRSRSMPFLRVTEMAAMEPSFWSWEKPFHDSVAEEQQPCRNGAQLLELGKASMRLARTARRLGAAMEPSFWSWEKSAPHRQCAYGSHAAMEPSFWSWEKHIGPPAPHKKTPSPQWSPAFGAGKSGSGSAHAVMSSAPQWSPAFGAGKRAGPHRGCHQS